VYGCRSIVESILLVNDRLPAVNVEAVGGRSPRETFAAVNVAAVIKMERFASLSIAT
jgi:hypothetical protein